jgi:hypothetical protein
MFVFSFVPYRNLHFWTDLHQTLHTSPPWSGRDRRVRMDSQYSTFPTFSTSSVASVCPMLRRRWLPAAGAPSKALYSWFRNVFVWRHALDVLADDTCAFLQAVFFTCARLFRDSVSSVTPARVRVTSRTRCRGARQLRILTARVLNCEFAVSINKAQGQSLQIAGIHLQNPSFSHGQLYVACSRVEHPTNHYILAPGGKTMNIAYPTTLQWHFWQNITIQFRCF